MRALFFGAAAAGALLFSTLACAVQEGGDAPPPPPANEPAWSFSATGYYYFLRDQRDYLLPIAIAERGPLHIEARYNYEGLDAGSLFAGWKFSGGETLTYELTPMLGAVVGKTRGIAPGFEASVAYGVVDFYVEAEYMHDLEASDDSFTYAWSELGFSPLEWLRFGFVGQRTRVDRNDLDVQRGGFAQITFGRTTIGLYVFNPGDSANRFATLSLGAQF